MISIASRSSGSSLAVVHRFPVAKHLSPYSFRNHARRSIHHCTDVLAPTDRTASDKLFADAAQEEAGESSDTGSAEGWTSRLAQLENQHKDWTGEESMQDAVLRMLIDKYKPFRSGAIRTADEKLKESPPQVRSSSVVTQATAPPPARPWQDIADAPLLPSVEGHRPWHTTFKAPSRATASIKLGNIAPSTVRPSAESEDSGERTKRTKRELAKRKQQLEARRLSHARESILDYRLGLRGGGTGDGHASPRENPVSLKGWQSLVEDRIEKARLSGQFDRVEGRGQPIVRLSEERNPFIAREEFLMNRIVQRSGAAPPWVELQIELEASVNAFRETLRQSWTRRAIRTLTMTQPAPALASNTVASLRDREWEERERSYHDTAIAGLNSLVRKYNVMAPHAVCRAYYSREAELERAYHDCVEEIIRGLNERSQTPLRSETEWSLDDGLQEVGTSFGLWHLILRWVRGLNRRITKAS